MKINLNFTLKDFEGKPVLSDGQEINIGKLTSMIIMQSPALGPDIIKYNDWAKALFKTGIMILDRADHLRFKTFIENLPGTSLSFKVAVLEALEHKSGDEMADAAYQGT